MELQFPLSDAADKVPVTDTEACAQACVDRGGFVCASFTFIADPSRGKYGQCRLYRTAYSLGYLRNNTAKDFYVIRQPCHASTTLVEPGAAPVTLPTDNSAIADRPQAIRLALSGPYELLRLTRRDVDSGRTTVVGRSYDGKPWETAPAETRVALPSDCSADTDAAARWYPLYHTPAADIGSSVCVLKLPAAVGQEGDGVVEYMLEAIPTSDSLPDTRAAAARFLIQTTFGPTTSDINDYIGIHGADPVAWLTAQMAKVPSLHRVFTRTRANPAEAALFIPNDLRAGFVTPRVPYHDGGTWFEPRPVCAAGSRWSQAAFIAEDRWRRVDVTPATSASDPGSEQLALMSRGHLRTIVNPSVLTFVTFNVGEADRTYSKTKHNAPMRSMLGVNSQWTANAEGTSADVAGEWLQMDLGTEMLVTGVVAQGSSYADAHACHVTEFTVSHSTDGETFLELTGETFSAGQGSDRPHNYFSSAVSARHVRLVVQSWSGCIKMRAAVLVDVRSMTSFDICAVEEWVGGSITIAPDDAECDFSDWFRYQDLATPGEEYGAYPWFNYVAPMSFENPPIVFKEAFRPPSERAVVSLASIRGLVPLQRGPDLGHSNAFLLAGDLGSDNVTYGCSPNTPVVGPLFASIRSTGESFLLDRRIRLANNALPLTSASGEPPSTPRDLSSYQRCVSAPKSFLNVDSCIIGRSVCAVRSYKSAEFQLNAEILRLFYLKEAVHLYAVTGLRFETAVSPCAGGISRWVRRDPGYVPPAAPAGSPPNPRPCTIAVDEATRAVIAEVLQSSSNDTSADGHVRDVIINDNACSSSAAVAGISVVIDDGSCWQHVHPQEQNVYDFTTWLSNHPGGAVAIANPAWGEEHTIEFPAHHGMDRWTSSAATGANGIDLLGRLGDVVDFHSLPDSLQTDRMAEIIGATLETDAFTDETCGSPGEVANEPSLGNTFAFNIMNGVGETSIHYQARDQDPYLHRGDRKGVVWLNIALRAPDQLRQRMAWAMSQIFVINNEVNEPAGSLFSTGEMFSHYFDIFVRHAFGNYRDVMREVSYSPIMALMLSFRKSKSLSSSGFYPDENYAREIMQLFSMGLFQLHDNGTRVVDISGKTVPTYTQSDIMSFSRAWTGFDLQPGRTNLEKERLKNIANRPSFVDPMRIFPKWRDAYPKTNMVGGYVGDGLMDCNDLPDRAFLREGAKYSYLGPSSRPVRSFEQRDTTNTSNYKQQVELSAATSPLFAALCRAEPPGGPCQFRSEVTLASSLPCDSVDDECRVDTVRAVKLAGAGIRADGSSHDVYFEYIRPPCIELAFIADPVVVLPAVGMNENSQNLRTLYHPWPMCADPRSKHGYGMGCCDAENENENGTVFQQYMGERVSLETATARCALLGLALCDYAGERQTGSFGCVDTPSPSATDIALLPLQCDVTFSLSSGGRDHYWVQPRPCLQRVQVDSEGNVKMIDAVPGYTGTTEFSPSAGPAGLAFPVRWHNNTFPRVDDAECTGPCEVDGDTCTCDVAVIEAPVFIRPSEIPSRKEILARLRVGATDPATTHTACASCGVQAGVTVHTLNAVGADLTVDTIFEIASGSASGQPVFLKNLLSTVTLAGTTFSFRNAPMFYHRTRVGESRRLKPDLRDAEHETEAVLSTYADHPSTPPFVAKALIQRLVTSNPSPRYVKEVAVAFKLGLWGTIGTGLRGDLAATAAAIFLDDEAQSPILAQDGEHGALREPLIKLVHLMRALEITAPSYVDLVVTENLRDVIGQFPFGAPTVFSFFQHDHQPAGALKVASLVSPEAVLLGTPTLVRTLKCAPRPTNLCSLPSAFPCARICCNATHSFAQLE